MRQRDYPAIQARAAMENAEIFFADESGIRSDHHAGITWGVRGKTPVVKVSGQRFRLSMPSAISAQGKLHFQVIQGPVNSERLCDFLRNLRRGRRRKVFLIVDGHSMHRSRMVRNGLAGLAGRLELFFLPPCSPELDPDELVWNHVKSHAVGRTVVRTVQELWSKVVGFLEDLQRAPWIVRAFFCDPNTRYARAS